jgi:CheY-like chemotaxis protein
MAQSVQEERSAQSARILIVEDDPIILTLCLASLERAGFSVLKAVGSAEAHDVCAYYPEKLDLILLDLMLYPSQMAMDTPSNPVPRVHGDKLLPILRAKRPLTRLLLMSAMSVQTLGGRGMGWMVRQYPFLRKPFTSETLVTKVIEVLQNPMPSFKPSYGTWKSNG